MPAPVYRWSLAAVAGSLVAATLAGCGGDDEKKPASDASASPSTSQAAPGESSAKAISRPLKFDQAGSVTLPDSGVLEAAITRKVILTRTQKEITARKLPAVSSAYKLSAKEGTFTDLWLTPDQTTGVAVEVSARNGQGTQLGQVSYRVTRFDVATGKTSATVTVGLRQDPFAGATPTTARVVGLAGSTAVIDSWAASDPNDVFAATSARHATVAVDLGAKKVAWSARPARPLAVTDDRVVVNTGEPDRPGEIQGLGVDAGIVRWSALPGTRVATSAGVSDSRVGVVTSSEASGTSSSNTSGRGVTTSLALSDGSASTSTPTVSWNWGCLPTSTVSVCSIGRDRVVGWNVDTNTAAWRLPSATRTVPSVTAVANDVVYGLANGTGIALDAQTGQDLGAGTGSVPGSVSPWGALSLLDARAVFQRSVDAG